MAGNITKRGEGVYRIRISMGTDANGRRRVHCATVHGTRKQAESYVTKILRDRDLGKLADPTRMNLNEFLDDWLASVAKPRLAERTFEDYQEILKRYVREALGSLTLNKITTKTIQDFYRMLGEKKGLHANTIRKTHAVLTTALSYAVRVGYMPFNPADNTDLPRVKRREVVPVDIETARKFLAVAENDPHGLAHVLAISTGLRPQEYLALKWSDLDAVTGDLLVTRTLVRPRKGGGWRFEDMKTAQSRRTILLPPALLPMLRQHKARQAEHRLKRGAKWHDHGLIFCAVNGEPWNQANLNNRHFKRLVKAAGLPETLVPYSLRHGLATILLQKGEHARIVADQLGHASTRLTLDTYSHVTHGMRRGATMKVQEALFDAVPDLRDQNRDQEPGHTPDAVVTTERKTAP